MTLQNLFHFLKVKACTVPRTYLCLLDCRFHLGGWEELLSQNGLGGLELHHGSGLGGGGRAEADVGADVLGFLWTGVITILKSPPEVDRPHQVRSTF